MTNLRFATYYLVKRNTILGVILFIYILDDMLWLLVSDAHEFLSYDFSMVHSVALTWKATHTVVDRYSAISHGTTRFNIAERVCLLVGENLKVCCCSAKQSPQLSHGAVSIDDVVTAEIVQRRRELATAGEPATA